MHGYQGRIGVSKYNKQFVLYANVTKSTRKPPSIFVGFEAGSNGSAEQAKYAVPLSPTPAYPPSPPHYERKSGEKNAIVILPGYLVPLFQNESSF